MPKLVAPLTALSVAPVHVVVAVPALVTVNPAPIVASESVRLMPVSATAPAALVMVTVTRELVPARTDVGLNTLATVSARATFATPVIVDVLLPRSVTTPFTAIVLVWLPLVAVAAIATGIVIVQLPPAGMVPPASVTDVTVAGSGDVGLNTEPQVPPATEPAGTVKPAPIVARLSMTDVIVRTEAELLTRVIVIVVVPLCTIGARNDLLPVIVLTVSVPLAAA